ncbi:hypothetical protein QJS10_CPA01g02656 [Acorus calamus]|uniref:DUF7963 domain-containing protein n=1 Tax=Acorus calamus TaxID=4465 RepID=A0AAV9FKS2_ACOCL|nr:hypothetical protein QJS10_CPA01g02656 [Acorus calamus]
MATANTVDMTSAAVTTVSLAVPSSSSAAAAVAEDTASKAVLKRYEGLVTVRAKAIKGKGAWYWAHLEPMLVHSPDSGLPKAVKLRCSLCDAVFSASNPSRTASEHLKHGTCPNFSSSPNSASHLLPPKPLSALPSPSHHHRKRSSATPITSYQVTPLSVIDPSRLCSPTDVVVYSSPQQPQQHLVLSGGKEDLGPLAMLEDSVKKLKSPKASPGPALGKAQAESALGLLSDWLYESCGAVSFSSVDHPKFRDFLHQVGLPPVSPRDIAGPRLDSRYAEAASESDARVRDALFFQVSADGWRSADGVVNVTVNLPNETTVFRRAVFAGARVPSKYAEEVLWDTAVDVCGGDGNAHRCVGIVSDRFKSKALRDLESRNHWMVNLPCQLQGFNSLIKDFFQELQLFRAVSADCFKLAELFNNKTQARNTFQKYQLQELDHACLLRTPPTPPEAVVPDFSPVLAMMEDVLGSAGALQMSVVDESYKLACVDDPVAAEVAEMVRDVGFWTNLEAAHSLVKLVKAMAQEMEVERPLVGQCLPLWGELRSKVKSWCVKFSVPEAPVEKVIEVRFKKNYHPAWSAAYILDPLYLLRDSSGKYLPPFKCLTPEQEKDVDRLITRLVSREEAHIALMELMKWRSEGLDPLYAQAVQVKQRDPVTGKMRIANPPSSRLVWETCLSEFKLLGKVAVRLLFLHATACGFRCNWSLLKWVSGARSRVGMERAQKVMLVAAHARLERREFSCEEEKDVELFASSSSNGGRSGGGDDDVLNEVFMDATPSV